MRNYHSEFLKYFLFRIWICYTEVIFNTVTLLSVARLDSGRPILNCSLTEYFVMMRTVAVLSFRLPSSS